MTVALLLFVASGAVLVAAGAMLARRADAIADLTGLGRVWIGSVLLAGATSLPELTTDVVAVRLGAPDLAAGDLFGSSMANMLILAIVDLLPRGGRVLRQAALDHALAACLAITLNALGGIFVLLRPGYAVFGVGPESIVLALIYVAGTRAVYRQSRREATASIASAALARPATTLRRASAGFAIAAAVILVSAPPFAWSAKQVAELSGLGATFVGTWLVGLSTSLPELVTSVTAVRAGALDLAVGNLFGSNAFNMMGFLAMDLAHPGGSIFGALSADHALSAGSAVVLMALGLAAIVYRAEQRFAMLEPDSLLMILAYALGILLLYVTTVAR